MIVRNEIQPIGRLGGETRGIDEIFLGDEGVYGAGDVWLDGVCDYGDDAVAVGDGF